MKTCTHSFLIGFVALLNILLPAQGELLVYESFNYGLSDDASIHNTTITATGLTGNYSVNNSGSSVSNYRTSGLSFGSNFFSASGGSLNQRAISGGVTFSGATVNTSAVSGDLWGSYLFNYDESTGQDNTTGQVRLNTGATVGSTSDWFNVASDISGISQRPQISYDGSTTSSQSFSYTPNTTYLLVSKFTNVGATLFAGNPGEASLWILSQTNYEDWTAAGGLEADLSTYANGSAATSVTSGTYTFSDSLQYAFYNGYGSARSSLFIDEIRYGTSLGDIVAIPEPSTFMMLTGGMFLLALVHRGRN
jgi:hypothetical protein